MRRHTVTSAAIRLLSLPRGVLRPGDATSPQELTDEGFALVCEDNWDACIEKSRRAIQVDRIHSRTYGNLGFALNKVGKHEEAIKICSQGLARAHSSTDLQRLHDHRRFAKSRLKAEHISAYQRSRLAQGVSGRTINMEARALRRMLKRAKV